MSHHPSIALFRNGHKLAFLYESLESLIDPKVAVWDLDNGEVLWSKPTDWWPVMLLAVSGDEQYVVIGVNDTITIRSSVTGEQVARFDLWNPTATIESLSFSPDNARLASGDSKGFVTLWSIRNGRELLRFAPCAGARSSLAFEPSGRRLAGGGDDGTVSIWDADSGSLLRVFHGHSGPILGVAFVADSDRLVSCDSQSVKVWDYNSDPDVSTMPIPDGQSPLQIIDAHKLVSRESNRIRVTDIDTGVVLAETAQQCVSQPLPEVWAVSGDGNRCAKFDRPDSMDSTILRMFDLGSGQLIASASVPPPKSRRWDV